MSEEDEIMEDIITTSNSFEKQALDLVKENEALKAQVNCLSNFLENTALPVFILSVNDYPVSHGPASNLTDLNEVISKTPEQCLNSVKVSAFEEGFRYSCEVYNGGSSQEVIDAAVSMYEDGLSNKNNKT